jgi:hypothetical protein
MSHTARLSGWKGQSHPEPPDIADDTPANEGAGFPILTQ